MIEGRHFQNAYITRDIEKGIAQFRERANVEGAQSFEIGTEMWTPGGSGVAVNKLCFIWIDNLQYELIQPVSGPVSMYTDALPDDDSLKFHHICMRVPEWKPFRARIETQPYPVVYEGKTGGTRFLYLDARDFRGHYLEYLYMSDEGWVRIGVR